MEKFLYMAKIDKISKIHQHKELHTKEFVYIRFDTRKALLKLKAMSVVFLEFSLIHTSIAEKLSLLNFI